MKSITLSLELKNGSRIEFGGHGESLRGSTLDYLVLWANGKNGTAPDIEHFQVTPTEQPILKQLFKRKKKRKRK